MASPKAPNTKEDDQHLEDNLKHLEISLPKQTWFSNKLYHYQGFWCADFFLDPLLQFQTHFQAQDSDIFLTSLPKTGTTWLKSLIFSIINRKKLSNTPLSHHPLQTNNPHELVLYIESNIYGKKNEPNLTELQSPRLFATHFPFQALPNSIKSSNCRIVYVCRNPIDTFVSSWHFFFQFNNLSKDVKPDLETLEEYIGKFCTGVYPFGPYDEHILGYWEESKKSPHRILILEYEGLKKDPKVHIQRLSEFLGCPFLEEEKGSVMEDIMKLCSLESLKEIEVNKKGMFAPWFENKALFRKGKVGDWRNDLTPSMAKRIDGILLEKLMKAGFSFKYYDAKKDHFEVA